MARIYQWPSKATSEPSREPRQHALTLVERMSVDSRPAQSVTPQEAQEKNDGGDD